MDTYLNGTASAKFVIHKEENSAMAILRKSFVLSKYINAIDPDIVHIESINLRGLGLLPSIVSRRKIVLAIHDVIPHSGENSWKIWLPRFLFLKLPYEKRLMFYSNFSRALFEQTYKNDRSSKFVLKMSPYSFFTKSLEGAKTREHILFFGRLSPYKGIDILIESIPAVLRKFPNETFVIAGKAIDNYAAVNHVPEDISNNVRILDRYVENDELVNLILNSKFVVCPYLDASQSGVLMTAFALNTPVIATNVGAFPEYLIPTFNGILIPPGSSEKLAAAIKEALDNDLYKKMESNIIEKNVTDVWNNSEEALTNSYLS